MSSKAIIAGGSLAGLMTGIVMKAIGVDTRIYERSPKVLDDRGAGIVMQAETETFLTQYAGLRREQTGVRLKYRQYLNRQGTPDSYQEMPQCMSSWGLIYRALRGAFPNVNYHEGASLNGFSQTDHRVALQEFPDDIDVALKEWETDQLALGRHLERSGRALGNRSQFP